MPSPIADRVRAHCAEHGTTVRQLSIACGWDGSHLGTVLRRLDAGKDVRTATLATIATTMGRPVAWLQTGEMPVGVRLDAREDWPALRAEAIARYKVTPESVDAIGALRVEEPPRTLDAHIVGQMARIWADTV